MSAGEFLFPVDGEPARAERREVQRRRKSGTARASPAIVSPSEGSDLFSAAANVEIDSSLTPDPVDHRSAGMPPPGPAPTAAPVDTAPAPQRDAGSIECAAVRSSLVATPSGSARADVHSAGKAAATDGAQIVVPGADEDRARRSDAGRRHEGGDDRPDSGDEFAWLESMSPELIEHEIALSKEWCDDDDPWCGDGVWWDESLVPENEEFDPEAFHEFDTAEEYYEHRRQIDEAKGLDEYGATEFVGPPRPDLSDGEEERWPATRPKHDPNDPFRFIPKPLRDRAPTVVEVRYDLEPGAEWLGIPAEFWRLVEVHRLSGVELRCLLFLAFHWKNKARGTKFIVWTVLLAAALHVTPTYVGKVLRRLQDNGLLDVWTAGTRRTTARSLGVFKTRVGKKSSGKVRSRVTKNKLQVGIEPLRRAVSGVTEPLDGDAIDLSPGTAWGFPGGKCRYFAMPFDLLLLISALELPGQAQLAFFWVLMQFDEQGSAVVRVDTAALSKWGGFYSSRESRSALEVLCTTGGAPDEGLVAKMRDPSSGRWAVDVAPAFEAIKPIPPLRPSVRRQRSSERKGSR